MTKRPSRAERLPVRRHVWLVVAVFAVVVACLLVLTYGGLRAQSWLLAYVAGGSFTTLLLAALLLVAGAAFFAWMLIRRLERMEESRLEAWEAYRRVEEQLQQTQRIQAVEQLTGGIAHDLNNLLTAVLANADLLAASGEAHAPEVLEDLREAARRGAALIRKLLAFSRRERLTLTGVDLARTVREEEGVLRRLLPNSVALDISTEDVPPVRADAAAVRQILVNLVTNARDAMPHGGRCGITVERAALDEQFHELEGAITPDQYVRLVFADTGIGMSSEERRRAFEPFFTTKPPGAGTGLGLSMVYGLVKQHGGFIDLASERDAGTTVTIYLPVDRAPAARPAPAAQPAVELAGTETVLVVDDEEVIRRSARRVLERLGYGVVLAADGAEGLDQFRRHGDRIDLVILDVVMPRMTGPVLLEELRRIRPDVKVLFASGYTGRGGASAPDIDPALFLRKPWTIDEFARKVREALDREPEAAVAAPGKPSP